LLSALAGGARGIEGSSVSLENPTPHAALERPKVLLVDDNADSIEVLSALLENAQIDVTAARNGAEALDQATKLLPDAIVLDLGLPDVDGYAVLEHLKQLDSLRHTRFIALTGRSSREELARMQDAGFDHQLVKPPDFKQLIELIKSTGR
jgi:two-component system CheB/CheR fusion protein